ncbi:MAG TPA: tetratricopeptide repeat protein [Polyangia bacterium]|nr:tetratricopeptide repeat protein [Polyangia bacterium]
MRTVGTIEGEGEGNKMATTSEIHPEEMLTAARNGTLDARGRRDLMVHLTRCAACRMDLALASDITVEGQVQTSDSALLSDMVQRALAEPAGARGYGESRSGFGRSSSSSLLRRMILPAACLLLGGGVATGMWSVRREALRGPTIEELPARESVRPRVRPAARSTTPYLAPLSAEERKDLEPRPAPAAPAAVAPAPRPALHARPAVRHHAAVALAAPPQASAGQMFAEANRARRSGDYSEALVQYRQLAKQFPGSREEITGRMIVGELLLARHSPGEALRQFDSYLAASPSGTLAEEARVGRAAALESLGRTADERDAWQELLRKHPASVHAQRAKDRLNQLR